LLVGGAVLALLLFLGTLLLARRVGRTHRSLDDDPRARRLHLALARLRALAPDRAVDLSEPFAEVVAARLGQPPSAAVSPDLCARLTAVGVGAGPAAEAAGLLERLVAARYGGAPLDAGARDRIFTLAEGIAGSGQAPGTSIP
jgi:hypothetical protein